MLCHLKWIISTFHMKCSGIVQLLWNISKKEFCKISLLVRFRCCKFNGSENSIRCEKIVCNSKCLMTMRFNLKCRVSRVSIAIKKERKKRNGVLHYMCWELSQHMWAGACMTRCKNWMFCMARQYDYWRKWVASKWYLTNIYSTWIVDEKMLQLEHGCVSISKRRSLLSATGIVSKEFRRKNR